MRPKIFFSLGITFFGLSQVQFHEAIETDFFAPCAMSLGSFPTSTHILCLVGYVQYTTNAHTMGICCVLLEPHINVAYLFQCIAI